MGEESGVGGGGGGGCWNFTGAVLTADPKAPRAALAFSFPSEGPGGSAITSPGLCSPHL